MTLLAGLHEDHGATFGERSGRRVVEHYGRPERAHRAVRNGVGVVEMGYGVVLVEGSDAVEFVDNTVSNRVPSEDGRGVYSFLLDPQGGVEADMYVYNAGERLLLFTPPDRAGSIAEEWSGRTFIQDVTVRDATAEFAVFGVHGPLATEKIASVTRGLDVPTEPLTFDRGGVGDAGVTVVATDAPTGEEGFEVVCTAGHAESVFGDLLAGGIGAAPFGYRTWDGLTLEAGTPLFETELSGRIPNVTGVAGAYDLDKGCFVGQEVVSRVANRGRPSARLVGLRTATAPARDAVVFDDDEPVGGVTRAADSPTLDVAVCFAAVDYGVDARELTVEDEGEDGDDGDGRLPATRVDLPFVEGSARSGRLPTYPSEDE